MTTLLTALSLYGLATVAYQVAGLAIEAARMIRKTSGAVDSRLVPPTPLNIEGRNAA